MKSDSMVLAECLVDLHEIKERNILLTKENSELRKQVDELKRLNNFKSGLQEINDRYIEELLKERADFKKLIEKQDDEIKLLQSRLSCSKYTNMRNS